MNIILHRISLNKQCIVGGEIITGVIMTINVLWDVSRVVLSSSTFRMKGLAIYSALLAVHWLLDWYTLLP
jgi:hypothetical protein